MKNEELIKIANMARKNSFVPLTDYSVGAALLAKSGTVYIGTNIESSSAIVTNCAERVAIQNAYAHGEREFSKIAIVGGSNKEEGIDRTLTPCGTCLQYILEMCKDVDIICYIDGVLESKKVTEFLTCPFEFKK